MIGLDYQPCAACIIWFGDKLMLTERKTKVFNGYMGVVGGKIDAGETVLQGLNREIEEETDYHCVNPIRLFDCYMVPEYQHKIFVFDASEPKDNFGWIRNVEPQKHTDWQLFTREEALKLKLVPFLRHYLTNSLTIPDIHYTMVK